jgi:hypothetical protein
MCNQKSFRPMTEERFGVAPSHALKFRNPRRIDAFEFVVMSFMAETIPENLCRPNSRIENRLQNHDLFNTNTLHTARIVATVVVDKSD